MRFLQKFNIYLYLIFLFFLFFLTPKTYALVDNNTTYEITMPNYDELLDFNCGDYNFREELDNILQNTDFDNLSFNISVMNRLSSSNHTYTNTVDIYFYPKSNLANNFSVYYVNANYLAFAQRNLPFSSNFKVSNISFNPNSCTDLDSNTNWEILTNAIENNTIPTTNNNNYEFPFWYSIGNPGSSVIINNDYSATYWYYFSTNNLYYSYGRNQSTSESNIYFKKLHLTDNDSYYTINNGSNDGPLPSYTDIYGFSGGDDESTYIGYKTSLDTFYTTIPVNNVSNYSFSFSFKVPQSLLGFYQTPQEYINNTNFNYVCSARIINSSYYNYESFPCSLSSSYTTTDNSISYTFNNFTTDSSLSNYDKIYITIDTKYLDSNISTTIFDFNYNYSLGDFYNTSYKGSIYEKLTNLPLNFRLYFSSNNALQDSNLFVNKFNFVNYNIKYIGFSNTTQQQNLVIGKSILGSLGNDESIDFISTQVSNAIDTGIMIFQENSIIFVPYLDLFFNSGVVLSFNNSTDSDTFYYVDNTGSIQNSYFVKPVYSTDTSKYDISYYIGQINNFINDLSNDTLQFASLTQSFYNSLPLFFQTFIFVIFILFCIYFIYLLIKR